MRRSTVTKPQTRPTTPPPPVTPTLGLTQLATIAAVIAVAKPIADVVESFRQGQPSSDDGSNALS